MGNYLSGPKEEQSGGVVTFGGAVNTAPASLRGGKTNWGGDHAISRKRKAKLANFEKVPKRKGFVG